MNVYASPPVSHASQDQTLNVPSLSILLQTIVLGCTFVIGHIMRRKNILIVHEAGVALLLGKELLSLISNDKLIKWIVSLLSFYCFFNG